MGKALFRFEIGNFECLAISDGTIDVPYPPSRDSSGQFVIQHGLIIDVTSLFINTGKLKILVDTGCGKRSQANAGKLVENLEAAGIKRTEIDRIIYTHGHLDHVGGSFDANDRPVFPNARYIVSKKEREFWVSRPERSGLQPLSDCSRKNLLPISDQIDLIEDNEEALPGIKLMIAPGHTPGNAVLEITSNAMQLFYLGDLIHFTIELSDPEYYKFMDVDPEQSVKTRTQIIARLAKSGCPVFACHLPFPGLGRIVQKGDKYSWQPVE